MSLDGLCDYAGNAMAAVSLGFTTTDVAASDTLGPALTGITPANNSTDIALDAALVMSFDEPVDQLSAPPVSGAGITVPGSYVVNGSTITFTPSVTLKGATQYRVDLLSNVRDLAGNARGLGYSYFTTVATEDVVPPTVVNISPPAGAVDVHPGSGVVVSFSEPMNPSTLVSSNMAFYSNSTVIPATVYKSADGQQVTLTGNLPQASVVSVVLNGNVQDLSGNALAPFVSSFTTGVVNTDGSRPSVTRQLPTNGSGNWFGVNQVVLYTNEPMDVSTIESAFHVAENGVLVNGTLEVLNDGQTLRFTKATPFADGALVQVYLQGTATDASGNPVYDYNGYFNMGTSNALVGTRPYPTAYYPGNSMTDVPLNPEIYVSYTEELDPVSLTGSTVQLQDVSNGYAVVPTTATLDASGRLLKVTPAAPLQAGTQYLLYLYPGITDTDGDQQVYNYSTYFTTAADAVVDDRQPMVLALSPPDGETGVGVNARYAVRFDESMNPLSFDTDNGQRFNAQFSETNQVLRYERLGVLDSQAQVTEVVPALVDAAGNAAVAASTTFTTGDGPDFVAPTVVDTSVAYGQTGVATNPVLELLFSEPIDPVSVSSSGVYLYDGTTGTHVPVTVSLSSDGKRLTLVPDAALAAGRQYSWYSYYLNDLSGNGLNTYSYFTTGFAGDAAAPVVQSASVFAGETDVPLNVRLNVQYDEPLNPLALSGVGLADAGGTPVPANVTLSGDRRTLTVVSKQLLAAHATYTLTVDGVRDLSGNSPAVPYSVSFTTTDLADFATGAITSWSMPNNNTQGVPLNPQLVVTLSERVDPTTVTADTIYLYDGTTGQRVAGQRVLSADGRTLELVPDALLAANRLYYFYVGYSPYLKDLAGNNIGASYRYFTTGTGTDAVAPVVVQTSFADGTTGVPVNGRVLVRLSEPLGDQCALADGVTLSSGLGSVAATLSLSSDRQTVTVVPQAVLSTLTAYTLSLDGLCDYAGNTLAPLSLGFTTRVDGTPDTTPPIFVSSDPANGATSVPVDAPIMLNFDEQVDLVLLNGEVNVDGGATPGIFTSNESGALTFTPQDPFTSGSMHSIYFRYIYNLVGSGRYFNSTINFTTQ